MIRKSSAPQLRARSRLNSGGCDQRHRDSQIRGWSMALHCRRVQFDRSFGPADITAGITYSRSEWVACSLIFSLLSRCKVHMHSALFIGYQEVFIPECYHCERTSWEQATSGLDGLVQMRVLSPRMASLPIIGNGTSHTH